MPTPSARNSRTPYALLGFLTWGPMSGYDLKKAIEGSINYFWSESYGQIYPMLKRLADDGLATRESTTTEGGRDRHIYEITDAGRAALRDWLNESPDPDPVRSELLLKLFFGTQTNLDSCRHHIEAHRADMVQLIEEYHRVATELRECQADGESLPFWLLTLRNGELQRTAAVQWCDEALEVIDALAAKRQPSIAATSPGPQ